MLFFPPVQRKTFILSAQESKLGVYSIYALYIHKHIKATFKKPINWHSTITRATVGHTVSMVFYDPTCTNKIFHRFQTADVSGTLSMALLSGGQQTHPAATKTRKHIIYGFSYLPGNRKIKPLRE